MIDAEIKTLLEAGVHFGHQTHRWNPKMRPFIFMKRNGIHIIDLAKTRAAMGRASHAIADAVRAGQKILFVCTKKQGQAIVCAEAERCGMLHVTDRWLGGTLTNLETIRKSVRRLEEIEKMAEDGTYDLISKKEILRHERQKAKLAKVLDGIRSMEGPPGLAFIIDTRKERIAVNEARKLGIPVVGIVDTNSDPERIDYPIPGNDDAIRAIRLFACYAADTVLDARAHVLEGREAEQLVPEEGPDKVSTPQA